MRTSPPADHETARTARIWLALARSVALAGLALFAAHAVLGFGGESASHFFNAWVYNELQFLAVAGCALRTVFEPRHRMAWTALTIAAASWTIGDIYYSAALSGLEQVPIPSVADALYLAFYPAAYFGLIRLVRGRADSLPRSVWLDGVTAALAAASLGAAVLVETVMDATDGSVRVIATELAYPIGDVLLLALVIGVFALTRWRPGRAWLLIGGALALSAAGDAVYLFQSATGTYVEGTVYDVLWPAGLLLLAEAAWRRDRERPIEVEGRPLLLVPALSSLVAVGVLVTDHFRSVNLLAMALAVLTLVAVLARTALAFRENAQLLEETRRAALTDPVTGLGNRRRLLRELEQAVETATVDDPWLLAIFDLDGFKAYNDAFGHVAGDALLHRLAQRFRATVAGSGTAYRLGGDEFCVLAHARDAAAIEALAVALSEDGEGFRVTSSFGAVNLPREATGAIAALRAADQRLYAMKHGKRSHRDRPHDVLLQVLSEREPDLHDHLSGVATLAHELGRALGLSNEELEELYRAAQLHDIGKLAIPDAVLHKAGPLEEEEWSFIRRHTVVGQRILDASPALRRVGAIVRATHERWDGTGYPDGLRSDEIPLAARIIAVCDAFDAITSTRPYAAARTGEAALAELERCAGAQFDPRVVELLAAYMRAEAAAA